TQRFLDPRVAFAARLEGAFERLSEPARPDGKVVFRPALHAHLGLRFDEERQGFVLDETLRRVYFPLGDLPPTEPMAVNLDDRDLLTQPPQGALFEPLPEWMDTDREIKDAEKRVLDEVYRTESRGMFANATLRLYARGGESRESFDARCKEAVEDAIDEKIAALREKIEGQVDRVEDRIRAKEAKIVELEGAVKGRQAEEWLNIGETVLSFFSGRKKSLSSAMSKRRQVGTAQNRVEQANLQVEQWQEEIAELQEQLESQMAEIRAEEEAKLADTEEREVRLERNDIAVKEFSLLWVPVTRAL
ncbi:MAG: hypothetical protein H6741_20855, partial [Alphaproteobacteria bacterium]|nr:hypothetical protein [Alphaproteobacteria bacterium]